MSATVLPLLLLLLLLLQLSAAGAIPHIFSLCFGFPTGGALLLGDAPVPSNPSYSWTALSASGWGDFFAVAVDHIKYGDSRLAVPQSAFSKGYRCVYLLQCIPLLVWVCLDVAFGSSVHGRLWCCGCWADQLRCQWTM
jgi:hypothetical protein